MILQDEVEAIRAAHVAEADQAAFEALEPEDWDERKDIMPETTQHTPGPWHRGKDDCVDPESLRDCLSHIGDICDETQEPGSRD